MSESNDDNVVPIRQSWAAGRVLHAVPTTPEYEREKMAYLIAEIVSGVRMVAAEDDDFELADKVLAFIEDEIQKENP